MADRTRPPFPGMDPWMELRWGNTHASLATLTATSLNEVLPPDLYATAEERIVLDHTTRTAGRPDVYVMGNSPSFASPSSPPALGDGTAIGVMVSEPSLIRVVPATVEADPLTERYIDVRDDDDHLVTTIEWVSPTNKTDLGVLRQFHAKRVRVLRRGANTVEIDLTREGNPGGRRRLLQPVEVPGPMQSEYVAVARRGREPMRAEVYALGLRDRLPAIRIPLRPADADVALDLQALIDAVWHNGRYWKTDYARPLDPPLPPPDAAWAAERVAAWRAERVG